MTLTQHITELALTIAREIKTRIKADHPGVAKAWVCFGFENSDVVIRSAFNVSAVTRMGSGVYRVSFTHAMVDANYCWQAFARNAGNQSSMKQAAARMLAEDKAPEFVEVICSTSAGSLSDTTEMNITVWR